ncbi:unnamed protein product [Rotaria socialis]|uniref:Uncharacterized protein n=1 Tax=Rotaria socialis TaxID=392032 RepID=A0A817M6R5_9BILA|nr:unnamed protein product [Rotaria socialis]CAF3350022.1 unnamed protein product [Rotaria socialis]CAF3445895.1 unnamed protein product [Rotaria socialis]CAF4405286.1 unnamed protein product [Rotaria socialis]CAF4445914.1 unnamed protein product [Rotaria socialis]
MPPATNKTLPLDENAQIEQKTLTDDNENIVRVKKYLIILIAIQLFLCVVTLGFESYSIIGQVSMGTSYSYGAESLVTVIALTIFYIFGLIVTYKQNRIGLIILASIEIILLIGMCLMFGYIILVITALLIAFGSTGQGYGVVIFFGIVIAVMAFVMIITVKLSFNLAKLIDKNQYLAV